MPRLAVLGLFLCLGLLGASPRASAETRRAVLVGIDSYVPELANPPGGAAPAVSLPSVRTSRPRGAWTNLEGAVNDVESVRSVLITRFGFKPEDVHVLENADATRDRILGDAKKWLIDAAAGGDVSFFFFAGHGSQVRNSKSPEIDKMDETIVPFDANSGRPDIRDKEVARLFNEALDKKVLLTLAFDSCHSGSISRGPFRPAGIRSVVPDNRDVADPSNPPALESRGAVVLAAAQSHQLAAETVGEDNQHHGLFTWALVKTLRTMPINQSADRMFLTLRATMQSTAQSQEPDFNTTTERRHASVFGVDSPSASGAIVVAVQSIDGSENVTLQGGLAAGIRKDCELRRVGDSPSGAVTLRVIEEQGMGLSRARVVAGDVKVLQPGMLFEVFRWSAPNAPTLRVWMGATDLPATEIRRQAERFGGLVGTPGVEWVDDPALATASSGQSNVILWNGSNWQVFSRDKVTDLGRNPDPAAALALMDRDAGGRRRVMFDVPLPSEVRAQLRLGAGTANDAIEVVSSPANADFVLVGRWRASMLEYAWARPLVGQAQQRSTLPTETDWVRIEPDGTRAAGQKLEQLALRLGVIRTWLQIESPPAVGTFPYHLALRNVETGEVRTTGPIRDGDQYDLVLTLDPVLARFYVARRYVYAFAIDSSGTSTLLYPTALAGGGGENFLPPPDATAGLPKEIPVGRFWVNEPFGVDTYVMLTTATALGDPTVLEGEAIRTRAAMRGTSDPLTRLLSNAGAGKRSPPPLTPVDWSIERLAIESVALSVR